jgi:predicted DNA-binding transcriptional regulator YafY
LADDDVEALTYVRAAFAEHHPLSPKMQGLLDRLTIRLPPAQRHIWEREPAWRLAFQPVIDYSATAPLIAWLDDAIRKRRQIALLYRSQGRQAPILHPRLDPYDFEYIDRHLYLSAYSYRFGSILTFRIDRIIDDPMRESPRLLLDTQQPRRIRPQIRFSYRLSAGLADGGVGERFTIHAVRREGDYVIVDASDTSEFRIVRVLLAYGEKATLVEAPPSRSFAESFQATTQPRCVQSAERRCSTPWSSR